MSTDEIIKMAKQAGFKDPTPADGYMGNAYDYRDSKDSGGSLNRFAALIRAAALEEAARVCEQMQNGWASDDHMTCAAAIRQLKEQTK